MNIVVCYKSAPDAQDLQVKPDGSISIENAEWKIGEYDRPAIEAGVQIAERTGGQVSALSVGPATSFSSKSRKDILSRGPDDLYLVVDDRLIDADSHFTARTLAAAIKKIGNVDLVICGEGSADMYAQQVGIQLGELLDMPTTNAVSKIDVDDRTIIVERNLEQEIEVLRMALPAVITVAADITEPRVASMKMILAAGKKPVTEWNLDDVPLLGDRNNSRLIISTLGPKNVERKRQILSGDSKEVTQELVSLLIKEGVL